MKKETIAVYALSGDPITYGHINIIERAATVFDNLIVAIGVNPQKKYMFSLEKRVELAKRSIQHIENARVMPFTGLLVDFAYEQNADVIVKGVRNSSDFEYESLLHQVGESQNLGIDTHLLMAEQNLSHVSSSTVKAIQAEHGFIQDYVPLPVKVELEMEISEQFIIGITGTIAAGKSTLCDKICEYFETLNGDAHNIDMDKLAHELYTDQTPYAIRLREDLVDTFGEEIIDTTADFPNAIDRPSLGKIVFGNPEELSKLNQLMRKPILMKLKKALCNKKGLILLNSALIVEGETLLECCNNRVVVVDVEADEQIRRLMEVRGHTLEHARNKVESQLDGQSKRNGIMRAIDRDGYGNLWPVDTTNGDVDVESLINQIFSDVDRVHHVN